MQRLISSSIINMNANCTHFWSSFDILLCNFVYGAGTVLIHAVLHNLRQNLFVGQQLLGSLIITQIVFRLRYRMSKLIFHRHSLSYSRVNRSIYYPYCAFILP